MFVIVLWSWYVGLAASEQGYIQQPLWGLVLLIELILRHNYLTFDNDIYLFSA